VVWSVGADSNAVKVKKETAECPCRLYCCIISLFLEFLLICIVYYKIHCSAYASMGVKCLELFLQYCVYRSKFRLHWNRERIRHCKACHMK